MVSPVRRPQPPPPPDPLLVRLFTQPLSSQQVERRARQTLRPAVRVLLVMVPVALLAGLGYAAFDLWSQLPPTLVPRHRPEALCFALAAADPVTGDHFQPPMHIEPSAALMRSRFTPSTPAGAALREVMHLDESMVLSEASRHVGDFDVSVLWLYLPPGAGPGDGSDDARHWLVLCWMEGGDLAVCNFRFAGEGRQLDADEHQWGQRLVNRLLVPANFEAGVLPTVRLRMPRGTTMPAFGPPAAQSIAAQ
ncbi:MAG TPA: hypothetical protein VL332_09175 [Candidatus Saccharimonadaceae bacterium]|jgi:hypothetical protein|nr:hypothetical protein [Candidatus Saccharimonadaceae bacterium]